MKTWASDRHPTQSGRSFDAPSRIWVPDILTSIVPACLPPSTHSHQTWQLSRRHIADTLPPLRTALTRFSAAPRKLHARNGQPDRGPSLRGTAGYPRQDSPCPDQMDPTSSLASTRQGPEQRLPSAWQMLTARLSPSHRALPPHPRRCGPRHPPPTTATRTVILTSPFP
jgi:hypothetical protein